jgi:hypothetical protein
MARQHRSTDINDSAKLFSNALPFSYSHLSGKCRHKVLVSTFGETEDISCPTDVCRKWKYVATLHERKEELSILIRAIDELDGRRESYRMDSGWSDSVDGEYSKRK